MRVVLQESYMSLGEAGDVVDVKPGYARNFLIPQKIALSATRANLKRFEEQEKLISAKKEKERDNSKKTSELLGKIQLTLKKKVSEDGKLYGAVTTKDIEAELATHGATVDRRQIVLGRQIKMAGDYQILVKLVGGFKATVPLKVISDAPPKAVEDEEPSYEASSDEGGNDAPARTKPKGASSEDTSDEESDETEEE